MRIIFYYLFLFLCPLLWAGAVVAQKTAETQYDIEADSMERDDILKIITAEGAVKATSDNNQYLEADKLIFHQVDEKLIAVGHVFYRDETGREYWADTLEVTRGFKNAIIEKMVAKMDRNGLMTANRTNRNAEENDVYEDVSFSVCFKCPKIKGEPKTIGHDNNDKLWTITANSAEHDKKEQLVKFKDTKFNFMGVPVFYTPYFSHPDPSVKRKSGLLTPGFGYKSSTGHYIQPRYFWAATPTTDVHFEPIFTKTNGIIPSATYSQNFAFSNLKLSGAFVEDKYNPTIINDKKKTHTYHLAADYTRSLDDEWRVISQYRTTNNPAFYRKFNFWGDPGSYQQSFLAAEGFLGQNYARYETNYYQDLRGHGGIYQPITIFPRVTLNGLGLPSPYSKNGWRMDAEARMLRYNEYGTSDQVHLDVGYNWQNIFETGFVMENDVGMRTDYIRSEFSQYSYNTQYNTAQVIGRYKPEMTSTISLPMSAPNDYGTLFLVPKATLYASPAGGNSERIFVADLSPLELTSNNLFQRNRMAGINFVEPGSRVAYGGRAYQLTNDGGQYDLFLGQSINFTDDKQLYKLIGFENNRSSIIVDFTIKPNKYISLTDYLLLNNETWAVNRNHLLASGHYGDYGASLAYIYYRDTSQLQLKPTEQLVPSLSYQLTEYWKATAYTTQDYSTNKRVTRNFGTNLEYRDECFVWNILGSRDFTQKNLINTPNSNPLTGGYTILVKMNILGF